jgi:hypothetical protein
MRSRPTSAGKRQSTLVKEDGSMPMTSHADVEDLEDAGPTSAGTAGNGGGNGAALVGGGALYTAWILVCDGG